MMLICQSEAVHPGVATIIFRKGLEPDEIDRLEERFKEIIDQLREQVVVEERSESWLDNLHSGHKCEPGVCQCICGCECNLGCTFYGTLCSTCHVAVARDREGHGVKT